MADSYNRSPHDKAARQARIAMLLKSGLDPDSAEIADDLAQHAAMQMMKAMDTVLDTAPDATIKMIAMVTTLKFMAVNCAEGVELIIMANQMGVPVKTLFNFLNPTAREDAQPGPRADS